MSAAKKTAIIVAIIFALLSMTLSIAEIVVGSMYLHNCPVQRLLPIFLIVSGVFALTGGSCDGLKIKTRSSDEDSGRGVDICGIIVSIFMFAWLICGSVWVFKLKKCDTDILTPTTNSTDGCFTFDEQFSSQNFYCKKTAYEFAYADLLIRWILLAVVLLLQIGVICL